MPVGRYLIMWKYHTPLNGFNFLTNIFDFLRHFWKVEEFLLCLVPIQIISSEVMTDWVHWNEIVIKLASANILPAGNGKWFYLTSHKLNAHEFDSLLLLDNYFDIVLFLYYFELTFDIIYNY